MYLGQFYLVKKIVRVVLANTKGFKHVALINVYNVYDLCQFLVSHDLTNPPTTTWLFGSQSDIHIRSSGRLIFKGKITFERVFGGMEGVPLPAKILLIHPTWKNPPSRLLPPNFDFPQHQRLIPSH